MLGVSKTKWDAYLRLTQELRGITDPVEKLRRRKEIELLHPLGATKGDRKRKLRGLKRVKKETVKQQKAVNVRQKKVWEPGAVNTYAHRGQVLKSLGYPTYADYLASPIWATIRAGAFARYNSRCQLCPNRAEVVHHLDYAAATLKGRRPTSLVALCHTCHHGVEFDGERKRSLPEVQAEYRRRRITRCPG
jgi:hypothetical protein